MDIYLIRHGQTQSNSDVIYAGRSLEKILPAAEDDVRSVGKFLKSQGIERLYSSPLPRTRMTAEIVGEVVGTPVRIADAMVEIDFGPWTGLDAKTIAERFPTAWHDWRNDPFSMRVDGIEGLQQVQERSIKWIIDIYRMEHKKLKHGAIAAVTHETNIKAIACFSPGKTRKTYRKMTVGNCSVHLVRVNESGVLEFKENVFNP